MRKEATSDWIALRPSFADDGASVELFVECAVEIASRAEGTEETDPLALAELREGLLTAARARLGAEYQVARVAISVLCDLACQGWDIRVDDGEVSIRRPPGIEDRDSEKERVRKALLVARDEQLRKPAVRRFVQSMEARRLAGSDWVSILSLVRDGRSLAHQLARLGTCAERDRAAGLREAIEPYLQFVTEDARCEWTGLLLRDVWRYLRHTWLTPARSTPGRTMMVLVRDAAVEPHAVIGIAALSSSIIQQRERDEWIGWDADSVLDALEAPEENDARWLLRSLDDCIDGIFTSDFEDEGVLTESDAEDGPEATIERLQELAESEIAKHRHYTQIHATKRQQAVHDGTSLVHSHLYRSKRARALAKLLQIRRSFRDAGFTRASAASLRRAMQQREFRAAVGGLVREIKAGRVGINMMDISVAGAVAPYNPLLGGKLVSLLLASPEVREALMRRYGKMPSVIASGMKGEPVVRAPDVVLLGTTGIFGGGSSQYNRLRMPITSSGKRPAEVKFIRLRGRTAYSTYHFSEVTMDELRIYMEQWHEGMTVHGIFGEGVNPKMRKIRAALSRLGFPHDELLQSGSPRAIYVIPLAHNFREVLLGRSDEPDYIVPGDDARGWTERIVEFWRERWLSGRIQRPGVLEAVAEHVTTHPVRHGAVVPLPELDEDEGQLSFEEAVNTMNDS